MTGKDLTLNLNQPCQRQTIYVALDGTAVPVQSVGNTGDGVGLILYRSKQFKSPDSEYAQKIGGIFETDYTVFRQWPSLISQFGDASAASKKLAFI